MNYQRLGYKTFWLLALQKSKFAGLGLGLTVVLYFLKLNLNISLTDLISKAIVILLAFSLLSFIASLANGWAEYINYKYLLDENGLKIQKGIVNKEEMAIPYRQIQNVDIERGPLEQIFGLSRLVILTAGHEDKPESDKEESEGILPAIDDGLAHRLREALLNKTSVEEVKVES